MQKSFALSLQSPYKLSSAWCKAAPASCLARIAAGPGPVGFGSRACKRRRCLPLGLTDPRLGGLSHQRPNHNQQKLLHPTLAKVKQLVRDHAWANLSQLEQNVNQPIIVLQRGSKLETVSTIILRVCFKRFRSRRSCLTKRKRNFSSYTKSGIMFSLFPYVLERC